MRNPEVEPVRWHEDRELFRAAVTFTSARTGFAERLVEKDYFCSVVLQYLGEVQGLVFKGGTCLAKAHADFYRLSEDLDFTIPMPTDSTRRQRSARARGFKRAVEQLSTRLQTLRVANPVRGANESTQYLADVAYSSVVTGDEEQIKLELGLREPLVESPLVASCATLLRHPATDEPMIGPVELTCMSLRESLAEKLRAALSRREVAIRDFFDLDFAVRRLAVDLHDSALLDIAWTKLMVPGNLPVNVSASRLAALSAQLGPGLEPVLRPDDLAEFDLERVFAMVCEVASRLGPSR